LVQVSDTSLSFPTFSQCLYLVVLFLAGSVDWEIWKRLMEQSWFGNYDAEEIRHI